MKSIRAQEKSSRRQGGTGGDSPGSSIDMCAKIRHLWIAMFGIGVLMFQAMGVHWVGSYCSRCGLIREAYVRTCFGIDVHSQVRYAPTEYHRLYQRFISEACNHRWQAYSLGHHCPPGYARLPTVLRDRYGWGAIALHLLNRLEDRTKVIAVLTSFDLAKDGSDLIGGGFDHVMAIAPAIAELEGVTDTSSEEVWWAKHGHLFPGQAPSNLSPQQARPATARSGQ